jgi:hypothetical protein
MQKAAGLPRRFLWRRRESAGAPGPCPRLTANPNPPYSPAVACHDAMRNQATIASFRIVAAEAGGIAAPGAETAHAAASGHHGWLNQADGSEREHGYNCFPHCATPFCHPKGTQHFHGEIIRRSNILRGKLTVSRQCRDKQDRVSWRPPSPDPRTTPGRPPARPRAGV